MPPVLHHDHRPGKPVNWPRESALPWHLTITHTSARPQPAGACNIFSIDLTAPTTSWPKRRSEGFLARNSRTIGTVVQTYALTGTTMRRGDTLLSARECLPHRPGGSPKPSRLAPS